MAVRSDTLCIVLGRVACQLPWTALAEVFLRPRCFSVIDCEVFGSLVKPYTDKFRPKTGVWPQRVFHKISIKVRVNPDVGHPSTAVSMSVSSLSEALICLINVQIE